MVGGRCRIPSGKKGVQAKLTIDVDEDVKGSELVKSGGEPVINVGSCMGGEGESKFNVFPGGILAGGAEVMDEMVDLLEGKVCAAKVVDRGVGF